MAIADRRAWLSEGLVVLVIERAAFERIGGAIPDSDELAHSR